MAGAGLSFEEVVEVAVEKAVSRQVGKLVDAIDGLRRSLPPQMGSVAVAAKALGCSTRTVWRLIRTGEITSKRVGTKTVVDLAALHPLRGDR